MIETVDSFQGKQLDVVILSCVRASADTGARRSVGFVSDLRRLNVVRGRSAAMTWWHAAPGAPACILGWHQHSGPAAVQASPLAPDCHTDCRRGDVSLLLLQDTV